MQLQLDVAKQEYDGAVVRYNTIRMLTIGAVVIGLLFAAGLGWTMFQGITRSLKLAVDAANAVAQGDLSHTIRVEGKDELAQLLKSLASMQDSLIKVVSEVRRGSDGVSTASAEIATGNQDLFAAPNRQASALEETAASMEELAPPSNKTPTMPTRPTSWRKTPAPWPCKAAKWWPKWWTP